MYRNCIFCTAELGSNTIISSFPTGERIAVDAARGRLWVVCPACARWNLAPIEERWEPVEEAERAFRGTRARVQSENIGIARLPDGTRLIRIGSALEGEIAAWRYGRQLLERRHRYLLYGSAAALGVVALSGLSVAGVIGGGLVGTGGVLVLDRRQQKVVDRIPRERGRDLVVRRWHVEGISLSSSGGDLELHVRDGHKTRQWRTWDARVSPRSRDVVVVRGDDAKALLSRALVYVNTSGATEQQVSRAAEVLTQAGSPERVLAAAAAEGRGLGVRAGVSPNPADRTVALAMEMALHEASERRALEGELDVLHAAWKEAEEIAGIADRLALPPAIERLLARHRSP